MEKDDKKAVGVNYTLVKNRIVRRMFEALGYDVVKLDRVEWRLLDSQRRPSKRSLENPRPTWSWVFTEDDGQRKEKKAKA
ncbi:MAG: hypothetical protein IPK10_09665 [Bacteroidetes bacterium]|nr:hypothetical protein [Bacteroidota bacterium]